MSTIYFPPKTFFNKMWTTEQNLEIWGCTKSKSIIVALSACDMWVYHYITTYFFQHPLHGINMSTGMDFGYTVDKRTTSFIGINSTQNTL